MSISTTIALRYLKANRDNYYFSWITILTILGVAIGVATMIVVLSVIDGFEKEMRQRFLGANAHILVYRYPAGIRNPEKWEEKIQKDFPEHVVATAPFIQGETMIKNQSMLHSIMIRGVDPQKRDKVQKIRGSVTPFSGLQEIQKEITLAKNGKLSKTPSIILGKGLISLLQAKEGDTIQLIVPEDTNPSGQFKSYKIVGIFESGIHLYDNKLGLLSIPEAQDFFSLKDSVTGIEVGLKDPELSDQVTNMMLDKYDMSVRDWKNLNRGAFEAIKQQKVIIGMIVWLVALVAGLNILTTLFISINQKQKEISILKALGATNRQIMTLFLKQSVMIGIVGAALGVNLAYVLGNLIERYQHKFLEIPEVYMLTELPVDYDWKVYVAISLGGLLTCLVAGIYPSWAATRVTPTEGFTGTRR